MNVARWMESHSIWLTYRILETHDSVVPIIPKNASENLSNLLNSVIMTMVPTSDNALPYVAKVLYGIPPQFNCKRVKLYSFGSSPNAGPIAMKYMTNSKITIARPWFSRLRIMTCTHWTATMGLKKSTRKLLFSSVVLDERRPLESWGSRMCKTFSLVVFSKPGLSTPLGSTAGFSRFTSFNTKMM